LRYLSRQVFLCLLSFNALCGFCVTVGAQTGKKPPAAKTPVKVPVWVESEAGAFWREGKRQSFKLFLDDKEAPIKSFQGPRGSTITLVVFDTVADLARVDQARTALTEQIKTLDPNHWIGLLRAQDGLSVLQEPAADRAVLAEKIQAVQVSGKAGLLDTLEPVSRLATSMLQKAGVRLCVLYVTDSGIANYRADYLNPVINASDSGDLSRRFSDRAVQEQISRLADSLAEFTIPIFILHLEQRGDTMNLAYQSGLERIAAASGGRALFCRTNDEIAPALDQLLARIESAYFIGFDPPAAPARPLKLRVEAADATGKPAGRVLHNEQIKFGKR
jgi:hypothetical protein